VAISKISCCKIYSEILDDDILTLSNTVRTKYKFSSLPILNFYATAHKLPTQPCIYGSPSHDIICIHGYTAKSIELEVARRGRRIVAVAASNVNRLSRLRK